MSTKKISKALLKNRLGLVGVVILGFWVVVALLGPLLTPDPADPELVRIDEAYQGPSSAHPLGTDELGRSLLADVIYGARISLAVGLLATLATLILGLALGGIAGLKGGKVDAAVMRATDIFFAFPYVLGALALVTVLENTGVASRGFLPVVIAIALFSWPLFARQLRGQLLSLRELDFVRAARTYGTGPVRLFTRHLLPNALPVIVALAVQYVAYAILAEAALSFIGAGIQEPSVSWGLLLNKAASSIGTDNWFWVPPGLALFGVTFAFVAIGKALQDVLGVKAPQEVLA